MTVQITIVSLQQKRRRSEELGFLRLWCGIMCKYIGLINTGVYVTASGILLLVLRMLLGLLPYLLLDLLVVILRLASIELSVINMNRRNLNGLLSAFYPRYTLYQLRSHPCNLAAQTELLSLSHTPAALYTSSDLPL